MAPRADAGRRDARAVIWLRRGAGLSLVVLTVVPLYRLLRPRETGLAGSAVAASADAQAALLWSALLLAVIPAIVIGLFVDERRLAATFGRVGHALTRWSAPAFAVACGVLSAALTTLVTFTVFGAEPNLLDSVAQLTHARYMAAGHLGGPADVPGAFWHIANAVRTDAGWFSQYPPGHVALLAAGMIVGAPWIVGALMMGLTASLSVLTFRRLLPDREALARAAALGVTLSPFLIAQSAAYMNHATAAMLSLVVVYAALRARDDGAGWAALAGVAAGALGAVRPLTALLMAGVAAFTWLAPNARRRLPALGVIATVTGLPLIVAHLWYNHVAFGAWNTFGYDAAWGSAHGLGFHVDPWGNQYGVVDALLYTSADLTALNLNLLETPLPLVTVIGAYLLLARPGLAWGVRILAVWAIGTVLANGVYWHHGHFMGPRMLAESAPAWIALACVSVAALVAMAARAPAASSRFSTHAAALGLVGAGVVGGALLGWQRLSSHGASADDAAELALPDAPPGSLVFVHGSWESRLASRLAHAGIPLTVIESALRQNPTCLVHMHLESVKDPSGFGRAPGLPPLDLAPSPREYLPRLEIAEGSRARANPSAPLTAACRREAVSDRNGARDASYMFWRGDLPGIETDRPMFARDLGPELNARLIALHPTRPALLFGRFDAARGWELLPYNQGVERLWGAGSP